MEKLIKYVVMTTQVIFAGSCCPFQEICWAGRGHLAFVIPLLKFTTTVSLRGKELVLQLLITLVIKYSTNYFID